MKDVMLNILNCVFPALMVVGAIGSLVVQFIQNGVNATCLQWIGASLLYTALMVRNGGGK